MKKKALSDKELDSMLNSIIITCLGGPCGDPDESHMESAAIAFSIRHFKGFKNDKETEKSLRGENIQKFDFLEAWLG